ncbi:Cupredoxin [Rickenella mellea]|uniref:Cupredoxin n=1 Tax=Rickenella mellea TaxID=50990 RepID=A0A4Y7Q3R1_9AGAM|nr:Cupredoxin [Rickenella mellea]
MLAATILALAGFAAAQQTVTVGSGGLVYSPTELNVTKGTVVTFLFKGAPGNHSVTQSTFADPCNPAPNGFDSGWVFIPPSTTDGFPTWNLTITDDSKPIWYYCKQLNPTPHCNAGMVGSFNAPESGNNTFEAFQAAAKAHSGASGQGTGLLVGSAASASAAPGPLSGSITVYGAPTGTSPTSVASGTSPAGTGSSAGTGTGTATGAGSSQSKSAAGGMKASGVLAAVGVLFGVVLA